MRLSRQQALLAALTGILTAIACQSGGSSTAGLRDTATTSVCSRDTAIDYAFSVHPIDVETGSMLFANIVATDGNYRETLTPGPGGVGGGPPGGYYGVRNRPGLYRLTVSNASFTVWSRDSIPVQRKSNCRIEVLSITAALTPSAVPCSPDSTSVGYAFSVHPIDAETRSRLAAVIVATDGGYRETLTPGPGGVLANPPEGYYGVRNRPGIYRLDVSAAGYAAWFIDGLRVQRDANCRIALSSITVPLRRNAVP